VKLKPLAVLAFVSIWSEAYEGFSGAMALVVATWLSLGLAAGRVPIFSPSGSDSVWILVFLVCGGVQLCGVWGSWKTATEVGKAAPERMLRWFVLRQVGSAAALVSWVALVFWLRFEWWYPGFPFYVALGLLNFISFVQHSY